MYLMAQPRPWPRSAGGVPARGVYVASSASARAASPQRRVVGLPVPHEAGGVIARSVPQTWVFRSAEAVASRTASPAQVRPLVAAPGTSFGMPAARCVRPIRAAVDNDAASRTASPVVRPLVAAPGTALVPRVRHASPTLVPAPAVPPSVACGAVRAVSAPALGLATMASDLQQVRVAQVVQQGRALQRAWAESGRVIVGNAQVPTCAVSVTSATPRKASPQRRAPTRTVPVRLSPSSSPLRPSLLPTVVIEQSAPTPSRPLSPLAIRPVTSPPRRKPVNQRSRFARQVAAPSPEPAEFSAGLAQRQKERVSPEVTSPRMDSWQSEQSTIADLSSLQTSGPDVTPAGDIYSDSDSDEHDEMRSATAPDESLRLQRMPRFSLEEAQEPITSGSPNATTPCRGSLAYTVSSSRFSRLSASLSSSCSVLGEGVDGPSGAATPSESVSARQTLTSGAVTPSESASARPSLVLVSTPPSPSAAAAAETTAAGASSAAAAAEPKTAADWKDLYFTEHGYSPRCPKQFHSFVQNRGGTLPYRSLVAAGIIAAP